MLDHPIADEPHHLRQVLALEAYARACFADPQCSKQAVRAAFGLSAAGHDDMLLAAMLQLAGGRFAEGKAMLLSRGLASADNISAAYAVAASVFKYFNAGMPIRQLAEFGIDLALQWFQRYPRSLAAARALLDLLLYFGCANDAERILAQVGVEPLAEEAAELQIYRQRLCDYRDQYRLSIVLITYQRPEMLRHTLASLRGALTTADAQIIIGVNDDWPQTRQVIEQAGISQVFYNQGNSGINLYKQIFLQAKGEYLIEIDDDVQQFPPGFDRQIIACLEARPDLGLVGHWPVGFVNPRSGEHYPAAESAHAQCEIAGLPCGLGPVAGVCAGLRRKDFLTINGFARATLSKYSGEEPQLIRKLALYGKQSGVIFDQGLMVNVLD